MTTSQSPRSAIKKQADRIAAMIKTAERGEKIDVRFAEKIEAARHRESLIFAVVMDDKVLKIEMPWATIRATSEVGLSEYIVNQMRGAPETVQ